MGDGSFELPLHKNAKGEPPLDVARERLHFCPSNPHAFKVFTCIFGDDPNLQRRVCARTAAMQRTAVRKHSDANTKNLAGRVVLTAWSEGLS